MLDPAGPKRKPPGLLKIMKMAADPEFKRNIERSQAQLLHGHAMIAALDPEDHAKIHASIQVDPAVRADNPEMADAIEAGLCLYRMISLKYYLKFGMESFNSLREKFPGVD